MIDLIPSDFGYLKDEFTFLDLAHNFRNSREIVNMTKSCADKKGYGFKKCIVMPPENFPQGCPPIFVKSLADAMKEARKRTKDGILVVDNLEDIKIDVDHLNQTKEKWKRYYYDTNDFKENENPYKFLQERNVLVVDGHLINGFEWTTVVIVKGHTISMHATYHECNHMMRCTTNLIVVSGEENIN